MLINPLSVIGTNLITPFRQKKKQNRIMIHN